MAKSIQRQSILSTVVIYIGFAFGAINLFLLQNLIGKEYFGLTRVVNDFCFMAAAFATFGSQTVISKFHSFYKHYLPPEKNDLTFLATILAFTGAIITLVLLFIFKPWIITVFGRNNSFFVDYYWMLIPYFLFVWAFLFYEPFGWVAGKTVTTNLLRETLIRMLITLLIILFVFKIIDLNGFMIGYAYIYLVPVLVGYFLLVKKWKGISFHFTFSKATKRLKWLIFSFTSFHFFSVLIGIIAAVCDTLFLGSMKGFGYAAQFALAQYFGSVLEVPNRAILGSATPVLVNYWRAKNLHGIQSIYRKSAINLMIAGLFFGGLILINLKNVLSFFDPSFIIIIIPSIIVIASKVVDLATGLNSQIIVTSNNWKFDFYSTMVYSVVALPLNFFLIKEWGIYGAAMANLMANIVKNGIRWVYLYKKYKLQPFTFKNLEIVLVSAAVITGIWFLPFFKNVFIDTPIRSIIFCVIFGLIVIQRKYSDEVTFLYKKYKNLVIGKVVGQRKTNN